MQHTA